MVWIWILNLVKIIYVNVYYVYVDMGILKVVDVLGGCVYVCMWLVNEILFQVFKNLFIPHC